MAVTATHVRCVCGGWRTITTDGNGRTVEHCADCDRLERQREAALQFERRAWELVATRAGLSIDGLRRKLGMKDPKPEKQCRVCGGTLGRRTKILLCAEHRGHTTKYTIHYSRNEDGHRICAHCGSLLLNNSRGRPPKYCILHRDPATRRAAA